MYIATYVKQSRLHDILIKYLLWTKGFIGMLYCIQNILTKLD